MEGSGVDRWGWMVHALSVGAFVKGKRCGREGRRSKNIRFRCTIVLHCQQLGVCNGGKSARLSPQMGVCRAGRQGPGHPDVLAGGSRGAFWGAGGGVDRNAPRGFIREGPVIQLVPE